MSREKNILQEKFPFLSLITYGSEEMLVIIQNVSKNIVSAYVLNKILNPEHKKRFIELGDIWWTESNRKIPINLFCKQEFDMFEPYLMNFIAKEVVIENGPVVSLHSLNQKRVKRKRIELVIKQK